MPTTLDPSKIQDYSGTVQLDDGSIWRTGYDQTGRLLLQNQIRPPKTPPPPSDNPGGQAKYVPERNYNRPIDNLLPIPVDETFQKRLSSILKDNASIRTQRGLKRGKLDMKRLWKVSTNTDTIFKGKRDQSGKRYNIMLVVDESGSMSNNYIYKAANVAAFLADNFQHLDINLGVLGYSNNTRLRKGFDQTIKPQRLQADLVGDMMGGGTNDLRGLTEAYKLLRGQEGQSLVIVITDGQGGDSSLKPFIERHKFIKTFAIGIGGAVPGGYPNAIEVKDIDELKPAVLNILQSQITRR